MEIKINTTVYIYTEKRYSAYVDGAVIGYNALAVVFGSNIIDFDFCEDTEEQAIRKLKEYLDF